MRKYVFGTGIIGAITAGFSLLRGTRDEQFTWRTALAWISWGITLALAIGTIMEVRRDEKAIVPVEHPEPSKEERRILKRMR